MHWKTSESHPLRIAKLCLSAEQSLGLSFCPGKTQRNALSGPWRRDLHADLTRVRDSGYEVVVSLIEEHEFHQLDVQALFQGAVEGFGMLWVWAPIPDVHPPKRSATEALNQVLDLTKAGQSIFVHCKGGLGRAGTVAAWLLTHFGRSSEEAVDEVRSVRPGALETRQQVEWVREHADQRLGLM